MKLRKQSNREIKKEIKFYFFIGILNYVFGAISIICSIIHYYVGFIGLWCIVCSLWSFQKIETNKIILEIRGKKQ